MAAILREDGNYTFRSHCELPYNRAEVVQVLRDARPQLLPFASN